MQNHTKKVHGDFQNPQIPMEESQIPTPIFPYKLLIPNV